MFETLEKLFGRNDMTTTSDVSTTPVPTTAQPESFVHRHLAEIEADLGNAVQDLKTHVEGATSRFETWVKAHAEEITAWAERDWTAVKAEKVAVVQKLEQELHSVHNWWTNELTKIKSL